MDRGLDHSLPLRALERALLLRRPPPGLIHHSDRGVRCASHPYQERLRATGVVEHGRPGDCWDIAVAEDFATLKRELVAHARWTARLEAHRALTAFIDRWYNHQRRHSALGFVSPMAYERQLARLRIASIHLPLKSGQAHPASSGILTRRFRLTRRTVRKREGRPRGTPLRNSRTQRAQSFDACSVTTRTVSSTT